MNEEQRRSRYEEYCLKRFGAVPSWEDWAAARACYDKYRIPTEVPYSWEELSHKQREIWMSVALAAKAAYAKAQAMKDGDFLLIQPISREEAQLNKDQVPQCLRPPKKPHLKEGRKERLDIAAYWFKFSFSEEEIFSIREYIDTGEIEETFPEIWRSAAEEEKRKRDGRTDQDTGS